VLVGVTLVAGSSTAGDGDDVDRRVRARVDPRVELLSIVFRLAGNPEYAQGRVPAYVEAVEARFGRLREHAVVRRAAALRRAHGVSYDAVMSLAVHLDEEFRLPAPPATAERLDARWPAAEADKFVEELRAFAVEGGFRAFFASRRPLLLETERRMQAVVDGSIRMGWFDDFFGARPAARFELALGLLNAERCYGPSVRRADGGEELHCVLGVWAVDAEGRPTFGPEVVPTVVHEFCHSYCNALVDAHLGALSVPGEALWPSVAVAMRAQAYGDVRTMLRESLVRACVVRYVGAAAGAEAAKREIDAQHRLSFPWTGELSALLGEHEAKRAEFPTLEAFMPRVAPFFSAYAKRHAARAAATPTVLELRPTDGAKDVDPHLAKIVVVFDRPMRDGSWSIVGGGPNFPKLAGPPSYDASRKVLTVPVELQPSWRYELWLNGGRHEAFRSEGGVPLVPVRLAFETRPK